MPITKPRSSELSAIARQVNLSVDIVEYCLEAGLVRQAMSEEDLAELRRIRRLQSLDINLAGIEIILRMRRRMRAMQAEMEAMAAEIEQAQDRFERSLRDFERHSVHD
jgi:DNA-binding transcriptional MerR regulator